MEFLLFVGFIALIFSHFSLRNRVEELENKADFLERRQPMPTEAKEEFSPDESVTMVQSMVVTEDPTEIVIPKAVAPIPIPPPLYPGFLSQEPARDFFLVAWFREQALIKIGSVIFFLGAVWFVSYAIEQNWISPLMRIMLGLLLAGAIYVVGIWRQTVEPVQYQVLTTLGTGVFLGTVIASQFDFSTPV